MTDDELFSLLTSYQAEMYEAKQIHGAELISMARKRFTELRKENYALSSAKHVLDYAKEQSNE